MIHTAGNEKRIFHRKVLHLNPDLGYRSHYYLKTAGDLCELALAYWYIMMRCPDDKKQHEVLKTGR